MQNELKRTLSNSRSSCAVVADEFLIRGRLSPGSSQRTVVRLNVLGRDPPEVRSTKAGVAVLKVQVSPYLLNPFGIASANIELFMHRGSKAKEAVTGHLNKTNFRVGNDDTQRWIVAKSNPSK